MQTRKSENDNVADKKKYQQMRISESSFNLEASKIVEKFKQGRDILLDSVNIALLSAILIKNQQHSRKHEIVTIKLIKLNEEKKLKRSLRT